MSLKICYNSGYNNVSKMKIFLSIILIDQTTVNPTSVHISKVSGKSISQTQSLLNKYFRFHYINRARCTEKNSRCQYRYRLLKKGKRTLKELIKRFRQGLDLDLMDLCPQPVLFNKKDSDWMKHFYPIFHNAHKAT